ncbi:uncharacterized protein F5147DRAFT_127481 [Suillus discolor]|uniref:Secreted protein n=1 Tax=Suillus discolor TaxID=1912936 RepID=A0A9P7FA86_9AGAM|nr:uncharacterized protein F5147DRAFT_127481 [Suillus discolor]KAG2110530.1 hypothetical protein F5147DRAFT_127481 [Suillus discolor]
MKPYIKPFLAFILIPPVRSFLLCAHRDRLNMKKPLNRGAIQGRLIASVQVAYHCHWHDPREHRDDMIVWTLQCVCISEEDRNLVPDQNQRQFG